MGVKIRCRRVGSNNDPCFRVVAIDSRRPRDGKYLELLGWYDPKQKEKNFYLNLERVNDWHSKGAQVSFTIQSLLRKAKKGLMADPSTPAPKKTEQAASASG